MLPAPVALALKEGRRVEPERFETSTIFFSDVVGFTKMSSSVPPEQVFALLNRLYTRMDETLALFPGLYKVETIGDACVFSLSSAVALFSSPRPVAGSHRAPSHRRALSPVHFFCLPPFLAHIISGLLTILLFTLPLLSLPQIHGRRRCPDAPR